MTQRCTGGATIRWIAKPSFVDDHSILRIMSTPRATETVRSTRDGAVSDTISVGRYDSGADHWDAFVRTQLTGLHFTHCHLYGWRAVMQRSMAHDAPYLVAIDNRTGAIAGVLPLVRVSSAMFGHFLVSVPFVNYGGPLGTPEAISTLLTYAARMAADEGVRIVELRSRFDLGSMHRFDVSHRKITVLLDASGGSDALWKRLPSKVRSQIRRPRKDGVTVRIGLDQARPFYTVFSHHMRDLGTPVMPWSFFEAIVQQFSDSASFAVAYHNNKPIACGAGFTWGADGDREFEITWASALREYNRISPNMLVYWELMRHVSDSGVDTFNFGRCTPGGNTHRFKTQWGTTDQPLWWYEHSPSGGRPMTDDSAVARLATGLWKHVPLPIANFVGPRLVRHIPL